MKKKLFSIVFMTLMLLSGLVSAQKIIELPKVDYWLGNGSNIYYNLGNVGIGTDNPTALLHLSKEHSVSLILQNPSLYGGEVWEVNNNNGVLNFKYGTEGYPPQTNFTFLRGGRFGIGTSNPEKALDVVGNARIKASRNSDILDVLNDAPANTVASTNDLIWGRYTNLQSSNPGLIRFTTWADGYKRDIFKVSNNGSLLLANKSTENYSFALLVKADNNLTKAIGVVSTISGNDEFLVMGDGKVFCREVTVALGDWFDNVFYDDYNLPTLKELETYIAENGHLPEMPSEKEMIETGLETSKIIKLQMKKIEELTLYTIEQQKAIDELKEEVKSIKNNN